MMGAVGVTGDRPVPYTVDGEAVAHPVPTQRVAGHRCAEVDALVAGPDLRTHSDSDLDECTACLDGIAGHGGAGVVTSHGVEVDHVDAAEQLLGRRDNGVPMVEPGAPKTTIAPSVASRMTLPSTSVWPQAKRCLGPVAVGPPGRPERVTRDDAVLAGGHPGDPPRRSGCRPAARLVPLLSEPSREALPPIKMSASPLSGPRLVRPPSICTLSSTIPEMSRAIDRRGQFGAAEPGPTNTAALMLAAKPEPIHVTGGGLIGLGGGPEQLASASKVAIRMAIRMTEVERPRGMQAVWPIGGQAAPTDPDPLWTEQDP